MHTAEMAHGRLYVAGEFTQAGGAPREGLAAFDAHGHLTAWDPHASPAGTSALAVGPHGIYIGGTFTHVGGHARNGMAAVDPGTGRLLPWNPRPAWPRHAYRRQLVLAAGSRAVYASGPFKRAGGRRAGIVALDPRSGTATRWRPHISGDPTIVAATGRVVRVQTGEVLPSLRDLSARTGRVLGASPVGGVTSGAAGFVTAQSGRRTFIGGPFDGAGRPLARIATLARLRADGSLDTSWRPRVAGCPRNPLLTCITGMYATALAVYISGRFTSVDGRSRRGLAAIDARTGRVTGWRPPAIGPATVVAGDGDAIYLTADVRTKAGAVRRHVAAVDARTGRATRWAPGPDGAVKAVVPAGKVVYLTGAFTHVGGQSRPGIAAVDAASGAATAWVPGIDGPGGGPMVLGPDGPLAAVPKSYEGYSVMRLDPATGAASQVAAYEEIRSLTGSPQAGVYAFAQVEASGPDYFRYDPARQELVPWPLHVSSYEAEGGGGAGPGPIMPSQGWLYLAGQLDEVGGVVTGSLAQLDPVTGVATQTTIRR